MEIGKILMAGLTAGLIIGVLTGLVILVLDTVSFVVGLPGLICPFIGCLTCFITWGLTFGVWAVAALGAFVAGLYAAKRVAGVSGPGDMLVGGVIGGLIAGVLVALGATIVKLVYPILTAVIQIVLQLLGFVTSAKKDIGALLLAALGNLVGNAIGVALNIGIFFVLGIFLGLIGGLIGGLVFKPAGKSK